MFFLRGRRRKKFLETPLTEDQRRLLHAAAPLCAALPVGLGARHEGVVQVLLAEKHFEGAQGLEVDDTYRSNAPTFWGYRGTVWRFAQRQVEVDQINRAGPNSRVGSEHGNPRHSGIALPGGHGFSPLRHAVMTTEMAALPGSIPQAGCRVGRVSGRFRRRAGGG